MIENVVILTEGVDKQGDLVSQAFMQDLVNFAKDKDIKCRIGHPGQGKESFGTFIGVFKNHRIDGDQVKADLHFADITAEMKINGVSVIKYVTNLATNHPDMFGTSVIFRGKHKNGNELVLKEYMACDIVDSPAVNSIFKEKINQNNINMFYKFKKDIELADASGSMYNIVTTAQEPKVGDKINSEEGGQVNGEVVLKDGSIIVAENGVITEVIAPKDPNAELIEDLQKQIEALKSDQIAKSEEVKGLVKDIAKEVKTELEKEFAETLEKAFDSSNKKSEIIQKDFLEMKSMIKSKEVEVKPQEKTEEGKGSLDLERLKSFK